MNFAGLLRNPIFIVLVAVTVLAVTLGGLPMTLSAVDVPSEERYSVGRDGFLWTGTAKFQSAYNDGSSFVTSWYHEGKSEPITATGSLHQERAATLEAYKYVLKVNRGGDWQTYSEYGPIEVNRIIGNSGRGADLALESWTTQVGGPEAGALRLELWIKATKSCRFAGVGCTSDWMLAAQDGARLISGKGSVVLRPGSSNLIEEGEKVDFLLSTGAGGPWKLTVYDGTGARVCLPAATVTGGIKTATDGCHTTWTSDVNGAVFSFVVPVGAYRTDGMNEWRIELMNSVTSQSEVRVFTIDKKRLAPEPPRVDAPKTEVEVDDTIRLSASSRANPETGLAIKEFQFDAWCGDTAPPPGSESWLVVGQRVPAQVQGTAYAATYEFRLDKACDGVTYRAVAYDTAGRPSGSVLSESDRTVLEEQGIPDANGNSEGQIRVKGKESTHGGETPETRSKMSVLIVGLLLAILAFLVWYLLPVAPPVRMLIIVGGALIAVVFVGGVF